MVFRHVLRAAAALGLVGGVRASVSSTGFTVSLSDVSYFLPPESVGTIASSALASAFDGSSLFTPITVVNANGSFAAADLSKLLSTYTNSDDVFQEGFLQALYIQSSGNQTYGAQIQAANISSTVITSSAESPKLNPGPYFVDAFGRVYEAWRLYADTQGSFTESVHVNSKGEFSVLPAGILGQKLAVAVPSRLYYTKTAEKPLAGVRLGIKDIYDIKGLRKSCGNRAWYWLYDAANATATPVQKLIDAGAIIVGKQLTSQFANGESPTADWVDYHEAFNPRGDGYQDTSTSSSGGGSSIGAYEWLDLALGSDTGGSVRNPAQVQGVFGNRPSHGLVGLENTMALSPVLDTAGLLSRDPYIWSAAAKAMYGDNITFIDEYPTEIKTVEWPTSRDDAADALLIDFLGNVTEFLSANATAFNMTTSWAAGRPDYDPLESLLNITYPILIAKQQIPLVREPFYRDYAAKHDGRRPFVDPVPLARWGWADNSSATVEEAVANKTTFMSWFNTTVLVPDEQTCSDSLLMYVGTAASTSYRNVYIDPPTPPFGFGIWSVSGFSEAPDYVVPIGEAAYNSTITNHVEYLPVAVDFMAAKGCDGMILSLIEDLYEAGIIKKPLSGQSSVTGGDILFRRGMES